VVFTVVFGRLAKLRLIYSLNPMVRVIDGGTVAVVTLPASDVRPVSDRDITHVRELFAA